MKRLVLLLVSLLLGVAALSAQGITGTWNGTLDFGAQKLRLVFNVTESGGIYTSTMDSPDQRAKGIPVGETSFDGGILKISAPDLMMTYEGTLDGDAIDGTFRQGGLTMTLMMTRGEVEAPKRPQTPTEPYPYISEEVTFFNKEAGITLAGTFTRPEKGKKFPAVVLLTGSGAQNRDEELLGHKPFLVLADHLTRNGIAVLRFDDRGVAASEGDYGSATIQDFATDASAAMDYLRTRKDVDHKWTGLLGHSEGGQIAFITAARRGDVAFIVTLAGPGVKGADLLREQRRLIALSQGVPEQSTAMNETLIEIIYDVIDKYGVESLDKNLDAMVAEAVNTIPPGYPPVPDEKSLIARSIRQMASPELMSLTLYDPAADLALIKAPIFALNGDKDLQVQADQNLGGIKERFSGDLTVKKYPELNHLFQHIETGSISEYAQIEETMSPEVLADIAEWINSQADKNKR